MGSLLTFAVKKLLENLRTWVLLRTQGCISDLPIYIYSIDLPCQWLAAVTDIEKSANCVLFFRRLPRPLGITSHFHTYAPLLSPSNSHTRWNFHKFPYLVYCIMLSPIHPPFFPSVYNTLCCIPYLRVLICTSCLPLRHPTSGWLSVSIYSRE